MKIKNLNNNLSSKEKILLENLKNFFFQKKKHDYISLYYQRL